MTIQGDKIASHAQFSVGPNMVDNRKHTFMGIIYLENKMLDEKIVFYK